MRIIAISNAQSNEHHYKNTPSLNVIPITKNTKRITSSDITFEGKVWDKFMKGLKSIVDDITRKPTPEELAKRARETDNFTYTNAHGQTLYGDEARLVRDDEFSDRGL